MQQKIFALNYVTRFQKYVNFIEWDDATFMTIFRRDLKESVKNEIMRNDVNIEFFKDLIEIAIDLDDKLYEKVMKKRYQDSRERARPYLELISERCNKERQFDNKSSYTSNYRRLMWMELNFTQQRKERNPKER